MTMKELKVLIEMKEEIILPAQLLLNLTAQDLKSPCDFDSSLKQFKKMWQILIIQPLQKYLEEAMLPVRFASAAMTNRCTLIIMYIFFFHVGDMDFNATEIVRDMTAADGRGLNQAITIFDDQINEALELFVVVLRVETNFTVRYTRQATVCRIPESDRK